MSGFRRLLRQVLPRGLIEYSRAWSRTQPSARRELLRLWVRSAFGAEPGLPRFDRSPRLLFVCHGNILRSAFAARYADATGTRARSAGLHAIPGHPADPRGVQAANTMGVDLTQHQARPLTTELIDWADLILAMDRTNQAELLTRYPEAATRVHLIGVAAGTGPLEVPDPYMGNQEAVEEAYTRLATCVSALIRLDPGGKDRAP